MSAGPGRSTGRRGSGPHRLAAQVDGPCAQALCVHTGRLSVRCRTQGTGNTARFPLNRFGCQPEGASVNGSKCRRGLSLGHGPYARSRCTDPPYQECPVSKTDCAGHTQGLRPSDMKLRSRTTSSSSSCMADRKTSSAPAKCWWRHYLIGDIRR